MIYNDKSWIPHQVSHLSHLFPYRGGLGPKSCSNKKQVGQVGQWDSKQAMPIALSPYARVDRKWQRIAGPESGQALTIRKQTIRRFRNKY